MKFDREYWEGMTRGALYEHISKLEDQVEELEEALDEKETPAAEVYELRKACRIYKELVQEKKAKVEELKADAQRLAYTEEELTAASIEVEDLTNSIFQYGIETSRLQLQRDALEAKVEELTSALDRIEHWPKHIDNRDFSTWVVQTARAALKENDDD